MKSIYNILDAQAFVNDIVANAFQTAFIYQTQKKLPHFILQNINSALSEATAYQLGNNASQPVQTLIPNIDDHSTLRVDNRAPSWCKTQSKLAPTPKSMRKAPSRYTRTITMKSQSIENYKDLAVSREQSIDNYKKFRVKPTSKSFIKLYTQAPNEIEDFKNDEKLRHQLATERLNLQKATQNLFQNKRKNSDKKRQANTQTNDMRKFVFHYDSTLLRTKQKGKTIKEQSQDQNPKNLSSSEIKSFGEISELESFVEKNQILSKKKKSINQISMPQIVQNSSQNKRRVANSDKAKSYHKQVKINEERSKSVIDLISKQSKVQKGVVFKQSIDGKTEQLKRDSIQIEKKVGDMNKKQFQSSFAKKKFISRVQKTLNDI